MKRPAICLFIWVALLGWAAPGYAKKGGGKAAAPAADDSAVADDSGKTATSGGADDKTAGDTGKADAAGGKEAATPSESLEGDETQPGKVEEDLGGTPKAARPNSTGSWADIVVVPRKAFLKGGRFEFQPFTGISVNDSLIRHYVLGLDLNYFLTDVFWIGLQGQYFIHQLTNQEELVGSEYNRSPTLNQYLYGGALNFGYVPIYGKFALFNRSILSWEIWASAGVGVTFTKVIPRDPANDALAFQNTDITPNVGIGSRFFLLNWLSVNFALRDYLVPDKFEPLNDGAGRESRPQRKPRHRRSLSSSRTSCSTSASASICRRNSSTRLLVRAASMNMNADLNLNVTRRSEKDMPMTKTTKARWLSLLIALAVTVVPLAAQAQRKSPLADAPAIRKRYELRASRLELGAGVGSTINQDFYHTVFLNLKLGFHFNDWFAVSVFGGFAVANIATTFQSDLLGTLKDMPTTNFEPSKNDALRSMQKINNILGGQAEFTPFTGKYSLAGWLFANYDFYLFGGAGVISVTPTDSSITACGSSNSGDNTRSGPAYYCGVSGSKLAATFGLGLHSYFNHWMALNVELRDMLAKLNPSGRDTNGDLHATTDDLTWTHTFIVAANLVFYLPSTPSISF